MADDAVDAVEVIAAGLDSARVAELVKQVAQQQNLHVHVHFHGDSQPVFHVSANSEGIMGDKFENVSNSTIVNRSVLKDALNKLESTSQPEAAAALEAVTELVAEENNPAASTVLDQFTRELQQASPNSGTLKSYWDGLVAIVPQVAKLGEAISKAIESF